MCLLNDTSTRLGSLTACVFIINFIISQIYKRKKLHNCKNHELETIKMHVKEKKWGEESRNSMSRIYYCSTKGNFYLISSSRLFLSL